MDSDLRIRSVDEGEIQLIDNALDLTLATIRPLASATARSSPDALETGSVILEAVTHSMLRLSKLDAAPPAPAAATGGMEPADESDVELLQRFAELSGPDRELVLDFIRRLSEG